MKNFNLNKYGVQEMNANEVQITEGGLAYCSPIVAELYLMVTLVKKFIG
jgi:Mg2+/citrate symporter